jgi:peptidoglycan-associated lipoprotein
VVKRFLGVAILCVAMAACETNKGPSSGSENTGFGHEQNPQHNMSSGGAGDNSMFHTIYFDFDKSDLREDDRRRLQENAAWLKTHPKDRIVIAGNCDERGTIGYNIALGDRRASAARRYLINLGIDPSRIQTVSYGKERPVDPGHDEVAWAKNRRDDFSDSK